MRRRATRRRLGMGVAVTVVAAAVLAAVALFLAANNDGNGRGTKAAGGDAGAGAAGSSGGAQPGDGTGARAGADVPTTAPFRGPAPILMYHALDPAPAGVAYPELFVPPDEFESELAMLHRSGFNAVTLGQLFDAWDRDEPLPVHPIVLSFDDGIRSQYTVARPLLRHYGWPGVLNLKVDSVTQGELDTEAVREMIATGWEVDSHTISHLDVATLSGAELQHEVAGSRTELRRRFHVPVDFFCYPSGSYDDEAIAAVKRAGYEGATTTDPGLATRDEPFTLKRVRVDAGDGAAGLKRKLLDAGVQVGGA